MLRRRPNISCVGVRNIRLHLMVFDVAVGTTIGVTFSARGHIQSIQMPPPTHSLFLLSHSYTLLIEYRRIIAPL